MKRIYFFLLFLIPAFLPAQENPSLINFSENKGQCAPNVLYEGKFYGGKVFLEKDAFTYLFYEPGAIENFHHQKDRNDAQNKMKFHAVKMAFEGCNKAAARSAEGKKSFYFNSYKGNDPSKWASNIASYQSVNYKQLYNGISIKTFSDYNHVRYDFLLEANADPSQIKLNFSGQDKLSIRGGKLIISTSVGNIEQSAPYAYQLKGKEKIKVACDYKLVQNTVGFSLGNYDKNLPLVIDPTLVFATFTGSTGDNWGMSAAYDKQGNGYTAGICFAAGYPLSTGAFQAGFHGGVVNTTYNYLGFDIVVSKFDPTGSQLIFSTYLGGADNEAPQSIITDVNNNLLVLGRSYSADFPVSAGAYDVTLNGGSDIILTKFNSNGTALIGSTFVGGSADDGVNITGNEATLAGLKFNYADDGRGDVIIDAADNIYVASCTQSTNFPVTAGCFQPALKGMQEGCVFKINSVLTAMNWSSYLGGSSDDAAYNLALDNANSVYVTGGTQSSDFKTTAGTIHTSYGGNIDGFLTHISANGNTVLHSTYIGTAGYDQSYFVQLDLHGNVYIYGQSEGGYPVTPSTVYSNPGSAQFLHELDPTLSSTIFSTVFGTGKGTVDIAPSAFLVDNCDNIYISGWGGDLGSYNILTSSTFNLPITPNAFQQTTDGMDFYFMVFKRNADSLWYATYFGGDNGSEEHVDGGTSRFDKSGVIYQAICEGCAVNPANNYQVNSDMPTTPNAWSTTNQSNNCNNALVKFSFQLYQTVAAANLTPAVSEGCAPFSVTFSNASQNASQYIWYFDDGTTSNAVNPSHTYTSSGYYKIKLAAIDSNTCNIIDTAFSYVRVLNTPIVKAPPHINLCSGDKAVLTATVTGSQNIQWSPGGVTTNSLSVQPSVSTHYTITATDSSCSAFDTVSVTVYNHHAHISGNHNYTLCSGDTAVFSVDTANLSYSWNTGQSAQSITVTQSGEYIVHTTDIHGCKDADSAMVKAYITPSVIAGPMQTICAGDVAVLTATVTNAPQLVWSPSLGLNNINATTVNASPPVKTTYTVTAVDTACQAHDTVTVMVYSNQTKIAGSHLIAFCQGDTAKIITTDPNMVSYAWSSGQSTYSISTQQSGEYVVHTTDIHGCKSVDSAKVQVFSPVDPMLRDTSICEGKSVKLKATQGNYQYNWSPSSYLSNPAVYNPVAQPPASITYSLTIANGPCITHDTLPVKVFPKAKVITDPTEIWSFESDLVTLNAISTDSCVWLNPAALSCSYCLNPSFTAQTNITYTVVAYTPAGCKAEAEVKVMLESTFYIPNTFTPNDDRRNETFKPEYTGIHDFEMYIYDRWGLLLYETKNPDKGWDGYYKGKIAQEDVYVYKLQYVNNGATVINHKAGSFNLLR